MEVTENRTLRTTGVLFFSPYTLTYFFPPILLLSLHALSCFHAPLFRPRYAPRSMVKLKPLPFGDVLFPVTLLSDAVTFFDTLPASVTHSLGYLATAEAEAAAAAGWLAGWLPFPACHSACSSAASPYSFCISLYLSLSFQINQTPIICFTHPLPFLNHPSACLQLLHFLCIDNIPKASSIPFPIFLPVSAALNHLSTYTRRSGG